MTLTDFANRKLFEPLGIEEFIWEEIPERYVNSSWGLHLKPLDFAKIGYLYLNNGEWNGQSIISERWKNRSTRSRYSVSNYFSYGYFWWRFQRYNEVVNNLVKNDLFFAWGDGGQFLFVIPHLNMVVVTTGGNYGNREALIFDMLRDYVFGSVNNLH